METEKFLTARKRVSGRSLADKAKMCSRLAVVVLMSFIFKLGAYAQPVDQGTDNVTSVKEYDRSIWKYNKKFMIGYTTGELDQKKRFGGKLNSRWGVSTAYGWNIALHKKTVAGFMKFGLDLGFEFNYMNFAKGKGSISDMIGGGFDFEDNEMQISLGRHYLTSGVAIGPNITFAPFYASSNRKLAALRFRPYFHVVPSYAAYLVSEDDDMEVHSAFAFWCAAGIEVQWKRLIIGAGWKGCTAKYKGMLDSILSGFDEDYESSGPDSYKFDTNMINITLGIAF